MGKPFRSRALGVAGIAVVLAGVLAVEAGGVGARGRAAARAVGSTRLAAARPGPALVTFVPPRGGICLVGADGSHGVLLTPRWRAYSPAWSPDGRYVAFGRQTGPEQSKIFVADGRGRVRWIFGSGHNNSGPLWSPDGRHIAYFDIWAHAYGLSVARPNGSDDHGIAGSPGWPTYGPANPSWTADGRRLAFDDGNGIDTPQGIFTSRLDGSDRRLLLSNARQPALSRDGSMLAYVGISGFQETGIFVAGADGTNPRPLVSTSKAAWPVWSPKGTRLAFVRDSAIVVTRADGTDGRVIASQVGSPPVWSPSGKFIAFTRNRWMSGGRVKSAIVVARSDGGGEHVVARALGKTSLGVPAWRPAVAMLAAKRRPCPAT